MESRYNCDVLIVGSGIAGLTAGAYLAKEKCKVMICEKQNKLGGLVNTFERHGFYFDGGLRSIENSGITLPMLNQLGIDVEFLDSTVSLGIQDEIINVTSKKSVDEYQQLLMSLFPENNEDITRIIVEIKNIMKYMDILYGIDNPLFMNLSDMKYIFGTVLPWMFKYMFTVPKLKKLYQPIDVYLQNFTSNQALIDIIAQHFFKKTPTFFALSYFSLYLDYKYPKGGTGKLIDLMSKYYLNHHGQFQLNTEITSIDPQHHIATDKNNNTYQYKKILWAADLKTLYQIINVDSIDNKKVRKINDLKNNLENKTGGDSVFTLFLSLNLDKSYFSKISGAHFFYTPSREGLSQANILDIQLTKSATHPVYINNKQKIIQWIKKYLDYNTYEISIPVLRDEKLAPNNQTGLVISVLFEYSLTQHITEMGWYDEFKQLTSDYMIKVLDHSIYPGLKKQVIDMFSSTPLTIKKRTGNADGAITGWAFTNDKIPAVNKMIKIASSISTPFPDIYQAGQWTYSPSGFPISVLTGKLAADKIIKKLK